MKDFVSHILLRNALPSTSQSFNRTLQSFIRRNQSSSPRGGSSCALRLCDAQFSAACPQQVCFCLCKCKTIWGTLGNGAAPVDKHHPGYLKSTHQRAFLLFLDSLVLWFICPSVSRLCCGFLRRRLLLVASPLFPPSYFCMVSNSVFLNRGGCLGFV